MRILSFDTSSPSVNLALLENRSIIDEQRLDGHPTDRKEVGGILMPAIDQAVSRAGWAKSEIDFLVVGVGPGSFTGIRVAVITARTLAQLLRIGLAGVSLLESSYFAAELQEPAGIVLSTTSNQFFYGAFSHDVATDPAAPAVPAGSGRLPDVCQALQSLPLWLGDEKFVAEAQPLDDRTRLLPLIKNIATAQAQLAVDRLSLKCLLGERDEDRKKLAGIFPWQNALPLYLRSPSVTVKKSYAP